jgi:hypothetical protein
MMVIFNRECNETYTSVLKHKWAILSHSWFFSLYF